jgi:hypothetical protein
MHKFLWLAVFAIFGTICGAASAQPTDDRQDESSSQGTLSQSFETLKPTSRGPTLYIVDISGNLATVDLSTKLLTLIGNIGAPVVDIAFAPDGTLYGISFTDLFKLDPATGAATFVAHTGVSGQVAITFDSKGLAYVASSSRAILYRINPAAGAATPIGSTGQFFAEGDLVFYNDHLLLAGTNVPDASKTFLVTLDPRTGAPLKAVRVSLRDLYGLASTGKNELYAFSHKSLFRLFPSRTSDRVVRLFDFAHTSIGQIVGATYDGNFQP